MSLISKSCHVLLAALTALSLGVSAQARPQRAGAAQEYIVHAGSVPLRSGPGSNHRATAALPKGERVQVVGGSGDWLRVEAGDQSGWIHKSSVVAAPPGAQSAQNSAALSAAQASLMHAQSGLASAGRIPSATSPTGMATEEEIAQSKKSQRISAILEACRTPFENTLSDLAEAADFIEQQGPAAESEALAEPVEPAGAGVEIAQARSVQSEPSISGDRAFQCALDKAREFHGQNQTRHGLRPDTITLVDYDMPSSSQRMAIVNLQTGEVRRYNVAKGAGGIDTDKGDHGSELGFMKFSETYNGKYGLSVRIDGLEADNQDARNRAIVLHGSAYVTEGVHAGRSWGCLAVDRRSRADIIRRVGNGGLVFSYQGSKVCNQ